MPNEKRIDRKTFLTSTVAAYAAVTLGGCAGESEGGGTAGSGGTATGGTATGGTATGGTAIGGAGGTPMGGAGASSGAGAGGAGAGGAGAGGVGGAGAGGMSGAGLGGLASGGTGGAAGGGGDAGGGGTLMCSTETDNGDHAHPLTVPPSDVEQEFGGPYLLEDGGTGHTHSVELTAYEYIYLKFGTPVTTESSTENGHSHDCVITCIRS